MVTVYICFQNTDQSILGIATSEASARQICNQVGDNYCPLKADTEFRSNEPMPLDPETLYNVGNGIFVPQEELKYYHFECVECESKNYCKVMSLQVEREKIK